MLEKTVERAKNLLAARKRGAKRRVYALVGASGTGKSFHAKIVAHKYRINLIVDDGLLIKNDRIIAGASAKEEKNYLGAVRAALFDNEETRKNVLERLGAERFRKILVLGTSVKMVKKITERLHLPDARKYIHIEDIARREEIETALRTRRIEGKHVIPAPQSEVKRDYSGIFFDAVRIMKKKLLPRSITITPVHEKSLVRPLYSRRERVKISAAALSEMATLSINEFDADIKIIAVEIKGRSEEGAPLQGYRLVLTLDVPSKTELAERIDALKKFIVTDIERFTGILVEEVNIILDKIT